MSTGSAIEQIIEKEHSEGKRKKIKSIYVASSWRNMFQPAAVAAFRSAGIETYDFKDSEGFHWSEVDAEYRHHSLQQEQGIGGVYPANPEEAFQHYQAGLEHPRAEQGFKRDWDAMWGSEACLLVLPSGRSAHLEAGWFVGHGRACAIWIPEFDGTWELMYKMADVVTADLLTVLAWAGVPD